jgi:tetratricopeptide (TPR) repeat protein
MRWSSALLALVLFGACATGDAWKAPTKRDTGDVPAVLRAGYGNVELHTWWPLTQAEAAAVRGIEQAKQGDAHALLALAIVASGGPADDASYARYQQRVDQFLATVKPTIDAAADDWHRGYELHRAMHRAFFADKTELGGYDFYQARVAGIFDGGRYNCVSSAMLFTVLARGVGLPVRGVLVPTHVFVEMGQPGGKIIEIETTSPTGFDWIHDERFYKEEVANWSGKRGLRPTTLDDYQHRKVVEPYQLMASAMAGTRRGQTDLERFHLAELAAVVDPDDPELQKRRIQLYDNEAYDLFGLKASRTLAQLFDTVRPAVADIGARSKDSATLELVSWATWYHASALMVIGRQDEAIALMAEGVARLDAGWKDAPKLRNNYLNVLSNRLGELIDRDDYPTAVATFTKYRDLCKSEDVCAGNAGIVYSNWSLHHQRTGDWQSARKVLQDCVGELPNDSHCREKLADLESRHRF